MRQGITIGGENEGKKKKTLNIQQHVLNPKLTPAFTFTSSESSVMLDAIPCAPNGKRCTWHMEGLQAAVI